MDVASKFGRQIGAEHIQDSAWKRADADFDSKKAHQYCFRLDGNAFSSVRRILTILANDSDEGHVAGAKTSNAMRLAIEMSIERRWVVSGS